MLNPGAKRSNLTVRWDKRSRAFVVDNLFRYLRYLKYLNYYTYNIYHHSIECGELDDLVAVLEEGLKNRAIGTK